MAAERLNDADSRDWLHVLGVRIANLSQDEAIRQLTDWITNPVRKTRAVSIVNAHTLNLASSDPDYRNTLNSSDVVYGDGTGIRWAARQRDVTMRSNLVGTDLMPILLKTRFDFRLRYYLLGATDTSITAAAAHCEQVFPDCTLAGFHHGYVSGSATQAVIQSINKSESHVLLVGMGNPLQERWIVENREALDVPVCVGVGGLFDYWAGNIERAPSWVRRLGIEWARILVQQPHKWRRYLLGNFLFLYRIRRQLAVDQAADKRAGR